MKNYIFRENLHEYVTLYQKGNVRSINKICFKKPRIKIKISYSDSCSNQTYF